MELKKRVLLLAAVLLALCCLFPAFAEDGDASSSAEWMVFASRTEAYYSEAVKTYTMPLYEGGSLAVPVGLTLATGENADISFSVPQDGQYELWFTYYTETQSALPSEMTVKVDGLIPFYELRRVKLKGLWMDDGVFPLDRYGNEIATTPTCRRVLLSAGISDSAGWTDVPFLFELTGGEHTLSLQMQEGSVTLESLEVRARSVSPAYAGQSAEGDALILIEGEQIYSRNKSSIRAAGEFDPGLTPYETDRRLMNFLDGASFDSAGDEVTWSFTAEKEGWYQLGFRYRQSIKADFPVFADVLIDGALPEDEASGVPFDYATSFKTMQVNSAQGGEHTFFLSAGEHTRASPGLRGHKQGS